MYFIYYKMNIENIRKQEKMHKIDLLEKFQVMRLREMVTQKEKHQRKF